MKSISKNPFLTFSYSFLSIGFGMFIAGFVIALIFIIAGLFTNVSLPAFLPVDINISDPHLGNLIKQGNHDISLHIGEGEIFFGDPSAGLNLLLGFKQLLYISSGLIIIIFLRKILKSINEENVFSSENVRRLRYIGLTLIYTPIAFGIIHFILYYGYLSGIKFDNITFSFKPSISLEVCFMGVLITILAGVFQEGNKMKKEIELTV